MYNKKRALGFRENFGNRSVGSIHFAFSFIVVTILLDDYLGFYKLEAHGTLMAPLSFAL
jgi:hypothetical protein